MNSIYIFWTGQDSIDSKKNIIENLKKVSECNVILITDNNLQDYILVDNPLHEAYKYLSDFHKSQYLRTYFMNFYGGGYSDIKETNGSWLKSFDALNNSNKWIVGYQETCHCVAYKPLIDKWHELLGNSAYICKKQTPLTINWYNEMLKFLDSKLDKLKRNPASHPRDWTEQNSGYPIGHNELLGNIFNKICYEYKDKLNNTLPKPIFVKRSIIFNE
jgi:hypothetical protein